VAQPTIQQITLYSSVLKEVCHIVVSCTLIDHTLHSVMISFSLTLSY